MTGQSPSSNPFFNLINNPKIFEFLKDNPIVGNVLVIIFLVNIVFSLLNIKQLSSPTLINGNSICGEFKQDVKLLLELPDTDSIKDSSIDTSPQSNNIKHRLISCIYKISEPQKQFSIKFHITNQLLNDNDYSTMDEHKVGKDELNQYCQQIKSTQDSKKQGYIEAVLQPSLGNTSVYPVFRWKCHYTNKSESSSNLTHPVDTSSFNYIGIDFDKLEEKNRKKSFCYTLFHKESYVLRYHYYYDPDSLYCTDPNFGNSEKGK